VFERFTRRARRVLVLAQEEARLFGHRFIGPEHILLGLIEEEEGLAAKTLRSLGASIDVVREKVQEMLGVGTAVPPGSPPFTPRAIELLELASRESLQLGHKTIDTEHLLLGLLREGESVAVQVLVSLGLDISRLRRTLTFSSWSDAAHDVPATGTRPAKVPTAMASELASRYDQLPVHRIRRDADFWALRRVEEEHVERLARRHQLDDVTRAGAMDWWLGEVQRRCAGSRARLDRQEQRRLHRMHRRRSFRSNAVFQLYWNTLGPGGRTWIGNRYATIRRHTFRIRWRP
jgi:ATP-dependent Clp protease ATP-binding subunit ClpA